MHTEATGQRPLGIYQGKPSPNTRRLVVEEGGFVYDADSYADDLPYYVQVGDRNHLVVPYTLDVNDMRFVTASGFANGEQFFTYLKDAFDCLYEEGQRAPRMMSVGLHGRIVGRPGRIQGLEKFYATRRSVRTFGCAVALTWRATGSRPSARTDRRLELTLKYCKI